MPNQWLSSRMPPRTPPSVMPTTWWMLCMPNVRIAQPSAMVKKRLASARGDACSRDLLTFFCIFFASSASIVPTPSCAVSFPFASLG